MTIHPPYRFPTEPLEWENLQVATWRPPELKIEEHDPEAGALDDHAKVRCTPAAESHGLWPSLNAPTFGRDVVPLGRYSSATPACPNALRRAGTGFARGAPQQVSFYVWCHRTGRLNFAIFETVASHPFRIILITHEGGEYAIQRKKRTHRRFKR